MIDQLLSSNVYQALVNASSPSAINPYITASVITSGYVPYIGATSNLNLGTFSLTAGLGQFGAGTNSGRQVEIFQDSANVKIGSLVGSTNYCAIYFNQTSPSVSNYGLIGTTNETYINTADISIGSSIGIRSSNSTLFLARGTASSGAVTPFTYTVPTNTGQTASTNIPGFLFTTGSRQWATGAITTQEEVRITSPTYSFVGASTITNAYTLFVNSPTAGTNATITNNYALGLNGDISLEGGNRIIRGSNSIEIIHGAGSNYRVYTGSTLRVDRTPTSVSYYNGTATSGAVVGYLFTSSSNTGQTASAEIPSFKLVNGTRTWAAGAITTQREFYITSPTYAFASPSTITNSYGLFVEAATAGTNATITNNYALGTNGNVIFDDGTSKMIWRAVPSVPTWSGIFLNVTPSTTNYTLLGDGSGLTAINGTASARLQVGASDVVRANFASIQNTPNDGGTSSTTLYSINPTAQTGGTASTEISTFAIGSYTRTWGNGNITNQRWAWLKTPTVAFNAAYTVTNSYGLYVEAATAGTNATITNNYAAGFGGAIQVTNNTTAIDDFVGGVTGSKRLRLLNITSSTTSLTQLDVQNNGSVLSSLGVTSGAYTGTGVLTSNTHFFIAQNGTAGNNILYGANSVSMRIKFINGGFATTNVAFEIDNNNNIICGNAALNTTATNGFLYVPSCAGTPTGVPTTVTGRVPIVADSTNNKLYMYSGGAWVAVN